MLIYAHAHAYNNLYEVTLAVVTMQSDVHYYVVFNISPIYPYTVCYDCIILSITPFTTRVGITVYTDIIFVYISIKLYGIYIVWCGQTLGLDCARMLIKGLVTFCYAMHLCY